jgi:predicted dithiol-disulfide oxidoreductase (DUF899 family)
MKDDAAIAAHKVVSRQEWLDARRDLLAAEKQMTRAHEAIARQRRALPWVKVDKTYVFDTASGSKTLSELFDGRSQLVVNHFMFAPDWSEGCLGCSFGADHVDGTLPHLTHHDVSYVAISRAPLQTLLAYKARMGWAFDWVSSGASDFNYDFGASFTPEQVASGKPLSNFGSSTSFGEDVSGVSVFYKDNDGQIFHTYSCFARGDEQAITTYIYLDMTPKGRNEPPGGNLGDWVKRHDRYED